MLTGDGAADATPAAPPGGSTIPNEAANRCIKLPRATAERTAAYNHLSVQNSQIKGNTEIHQRNTDPVGVVSRRGAPGPSEGCPAAVPSKSTPLGNASRADGALRLRISKERHADCGLSSHGGYYPATYHF